MARALIGGLSAWHAGPQLSVGERCRAMRAQRWSGTSESAPVPTTAAAIADCDAGDRRASSHRKPARCSARWPRSCRHAASAAAIDRRRHPHRLAETAGCGAERAIMRAMPNRPALLGAGVTGMYARRTCDRRAARAGRADHAAPPGRPCGCAPRRIWISSRRLSGSGPAYFFLLAEQMTQAAIGRPGARDGATAGRRRRCTARARWHAPDGDLARQRAEVTSKGGTTEAALRAFAAADSARHRSRARCRPPPRRSRELADQFGTMPAMDALIFWSTRCCRWRCSWCCCGCCCSGRAPTSAIRSRRRSCKSPIRSSCRCAGCCRRSADRHGLGGRRADRRAGRGRCSLSLVRGFGCRRRLLLLRGAALEIAHLVCGRISSPSSSMRCCP